MAFGSDENLGINTTGSPYTQARIKKKPVTKPTIAPSQTLAPAPALAPAPTAPPPEMAIAPQPDTQPAPSMAVTAPQTLAPAKTPTDIRNEKIRADFQRISDVRSAWLQGQDRTALRAYAAIVAPHLSLTSKPGTPGNYDTFFKTYVEPEYNAQLRAVGNIPTMGDAPALPGSTDPNAPTDPNDPNAPPSAGYGYIGGVSVDQWMADNARTAVGADFPIEDATPKIIRTDDGKLVAEGYWYKGIFYVEKNLRSIQGRMDEAGNADIPTLGEFMDERGYVFADVKDSEAWTGLTGVIENLSSEEQQEAWLQGGIAQAEQYMGLDPGTYGGTLGDLLSGSMDAAGRFGGELSDLQERDIMGQVDQTREDTRLILESLGSQGRGVQALMAADEIAGRIGNIRIQARLMHMTNNRAQAMSEFAALTGQYNQMVNTGMMSATEYIQRQREHSGLELAKYAGEISMIEAANRQYLMEYSTELTGLEAYAEQIYKGIQMELGVDSQLIDQMSGYYEMAMAPYENKLRQLALQMQEDANDAASRGAFFSNVLGMIGMGAAALLGNPGLFAAAATKVG